MRGDGKDNEGRRKGEERRKRGKGKDNEEKEESKKKERRCQETKITCQKN